MEFLCLAPSSHNFMSSPKPTPKMSKLYYPSGLVSETSKLPDPGELIPNNPKPPGPEMVQYLIDILASPVYDVAIESPLEEAKKISKKLAVKFYIKREDRQSVFSFKLRGAYNMMKGLSQKELDAGVVTASAGNHAQGVALSAQRLKCKATIVMPKSTPQIKIDAVKALGGEYVTIEFVDGNFDDALKKAKDLVKEKGYILIPPYDDPAIIKGQGTIGAEINRQLKDIYAIFVPVGGGGLISGIAAFMKQVAPKTKIIGVEPYGAASMTKALQCGKPVKLDHVDNFADGVAVGEAGQYTFEICRDLIDGMVLMNREGISAGLKDVYDEGRNILETSGALSIAGAEAYCNHYRIKDKNIVAIASGANMDFSKLKLIAELAPVGAGTEALLATHFPEEQGAFLTFLDLLGDINITEFSYRIKPGGNPSVAVYGVSLIPPKDQPKPDIKKIIEQMEAEGFHTVDLSHHDLAQEHLKHVIVGGASSPIDEIFVQFILPEIAGALQKFFKAFSPRWNITLFRYRNQCEIDSGVIAGFQVPESEMNEFKKAADNLGYAYNVESLDEALKLLVG